MLVALLFLAVLASLFLILLPLVVSLWVRRGDRAEERGGVKLWHVLVYFGALGLGFLLVEIPLIQQFILFLGHPTLALAAVLGGLLFWSGLGSLVSPRLPWRISLAVLILVLVGYQFLLEDIFQSLLGAAQELRMLAALLLLAPLGLLMGMPFPWGLRWLDPAAARLTAWAWAINGCTSVIASVLAALLALQWGFSLVMWLGLSCYLLALLVPWRKNDLSQTRRSGRRPPAAQTAPRPG